MVSSKGRKTLPLQMQWCLNTALIVFVLFCLASSSAFAACHAVSVSGAGSANGTSWSNAYAGIPGTLMRGDTYYFADGKYGAYTFSQADSGTTVITFQKAQSYNYGRTSDGCSNDISAGWNASTMGAAQAIFTSTGRAFSVTADYLTVNGNGTTTGPLCGGSPGSTVTAEPATPSDCGFSFVGAGGTTSGALNLIYFYGATNLTLKYVELIGSGTNNISGSGGFEVFAANNTNYFTLTHAYAHNSGCVYIQDVGSNSFVDHSYFWGTEVYGAPGSSPCHGQAEFEGSSVNNGVRSNNVYRDITGSAVWTFAYPAGVNNNWQFYNNVIYYSSPQNTFGGVTDGILGCFNTGVQCTNFTLLQNTIVNNLTNDAFGGPSFAGIDDENGNGSYIVENNLWYSNPSTNLAFCCSGTTYKEDYNSFLNSPTPGTGSHDVKVASGAPNPFVNWAGGNFNLASDNANWNGRTSLGSSQTVDVNGNTFTTDRGPYQYNGAQGPQSPTGLTAVVK